MDTEHRQPARLSRKQYDALRAAMDLHAGWLCPPASLDVRAPTELSYAEFLRQTGEQPGKAPSASES